jgi:hypothetical protein
MRTLAGGGASARALCFAKRQNIAAGQMVVSLAT